jgi:hypothetical protein
VSVEPRTASRGGFLERHHFSRWASDPLGWDDAEAAPGIALLGTALGVWARLQRRPVSIAEASRVFHLDPDRVVEAIEHAPTLGLAGPRDDMAQLTIEVRA